MPKITITVQGQGGTGSTAIDAQAWAYASPAQRVLLLHGRLRQFTKGQPFDIVREEVAS